MGVGGSGWVEIKVLSRGSGAVPTQLSGGKVKLEETMWD